MEQYLKWKIFKELIAEMMKVMGKYTGVPYVGTDLYSMFIMITISNFRHKISPE